jgi:drug/metabolite transporter (DMT)-like permease
MSYLKNLGAIKTAVLFLILANVIWGAAFPVYKWALEDLPPFTFTFLRFFLGALIILPFVINDIKVAREDYRNIFLLALFSISIQIPLLFFGLKLAPSINAPIIVSLAPIILIFASVIFLKEKLRAKVVAGTLISLLGIVAIVIVPLLDSGFAGNFLGNFLIFLATICSVVEAILLKKLVVRNSPIIVIFWTFLIGSLPLIPFVVKESQTFNLLRDLTLPGLVGLIYGIYFAGIFAHFLYTYGMKYIKASEVGIFNYVDPLATIAIAIPLLGEKLTPAYLVGSLLVFLGIYIAQGRLHYHPFQRLFSSQ